MASSICTSQPPKARKRINVGLPAAKQLAGSVDCSIITSTCETCNKEIPVSAAAAGIDAHDCVKVTATKAASSILALPAITVAKAAAAKAKDTETDSKRARKRKAVGDAVELPSKAKKEKDPNEPKRPPTAFFLFMEEFRATYKKANPNAKGGATVVSKEGGEKWKSMSDEAKEPFIIKGNAMKEEYEKALATYKSSIKESLESSITDNNADEKCDVDIESCEETAASADHSTRVEQ